MKFTQKQSDAAYQFQLLLIRNGAWIIDEEPGLIDSDSDKNVFNYDVLSVQIR
jgi:hypothetical protein